MIPFGSISTSAVALLLLGCYGAPQSPQLTARAALDRLREQTSCSRAVQGEAALSFAGEGRRLRGKVLYLAEAPERLRFDVLSPFGVAISTLTSDGQNFSLYNLEERTFLYGPAETCNVQKFTQVPVPPAALVELLRGRPPVLRHRPQEATISFRKGLFSRGYYEVDISGEHEARERIRLGLFPEDYGAPPETQRLRLLGVTVEQAGQRLYEVDLSRHQVAHRTRLEPSAEEREMGLGARPSSGPDCEAELPGRLEFYVPQTGYELTIDNEEVAHNPAFAPDVFRQNRPAGVSYHRSACSQSP